MLPNKVKYWSGTQGAVSEVQDAVVSSTFDNTVIETASDYLLTVERLELSLNGIPFYVKDPVEGFVGYMVGGVLIEKRILPTVMTFHSFLDELDEAMKALLAKHVGLYDNMEVQMRGDGYIAINYDHWDVRGFVYGKQVAKVTGIYRAGDDPDLGASRSVFSTTTRLDIGDELQHIVITSTLPIVSDRMGQSTQNVLADFAVGSSFSVSHDTEEGDSHVCTITSTPRQRMLYVPTLRRFKNIAAAIPLKDFRAEALYMNNKGQMVPVPLAIGGVFSLKLGFYSIR